MNRYASSIGKVHHEAAGTKRLFSGGLFFFRICFSFLWTILPVSTCLAHLFVLPAAIFTSPGLQFEIQKYCVPPPGTARTSPSPPPPSQINMMQTISMLPELSLRGRAESRPSLGTGQAYITRATENRELASGDCAASFSSDDPPPLKANEAKQSERVVATTLHGRSTCSLCKSPDYKSAERSM